MLFNSYIFIFIFLPVVLFGFHVIGARGHFRVAISWLVAASLFFYGWWNPEYLSLILISMLFNYAVGVTLCSSPSKSLLVFGVAANLTLLFYYKYANFILVNFNVVTSSMIEIDEIILPLAISFFTFQQLTYLIDAYRGETKEYNFLHYCLFVTFFPQLIAGPIVHHKEMLPQFCNNNLYKLNANNIAVGVTIFMLGLFKKVFFADNIAEYSTPIFVAAENGAVLSFFEAWVGALAYTFQLYFDFSGYSDMALGVARMFGVVLPLNFFSPYKSNNIIEFWRRWHITLSRFLRDYVYIPLGGNRGGSMSRYLNLIITMLLGGIWHGAGWTFIIWGGMHGVFLIVNHIWISIKRKLFIANDSSLFSTIFGRMLTFLVVVIAWVMFRSESLHGAKNMYNSMFGYNGVSLPGWVEYKFSAFSNVFDSIGVRFDGFFPNGILQDLFIGVPLLMFMLVIVWFAPNTTEIMRNETPALGADGFIEDRKSCFVWSPNLKYTLIFILISVVAIMFVQKESEFLYFQF